VSTAEPRNPYSSSRVLRCTGMDGKPTTVPNRNTVTANSSAAEWFAQLAPFNRDTSLFPLPPQRESFAPLCDYPTWTKSTLLTLPNRTAISVLGRRVLKLLSLHELLSGAERIALTTGDSPGYAGIQKGGLRCGNLAAKASGSVPGTPDIQGKEARS